MLRPDERVPVDQVRADARPDGAAARVGYEMVRATAEAVVPRTVAIDAAVRSRSGRAGGDPRRRARRPGLADWPSSPAPRSTRSTTRPPSRTSGPASPSLDPGGRSAALGAGGLQPGPARRRPRRGRPPAPTRRRPGSGRASCLPEPARGRGDRGRGRRALGRRQQPRGQLPGAVDRRRRRPDRRPRDARAGPQPGACGGTSRAGRPGPRRRWPRCWPGTASAVTGDEDTLTDRPPAADGPSSSVARWPAAGSRPPSVSSRSAGRRSSRPGRSRRPGC